MSGAENEPRTQLIDGRYRILGAIADGGMATIYKATDERLERVVAVKVMHTQLAQGPHRDEFIARFHREARSAAAISNPHIVQVYDSGTTNGRDYLVMEYVHGVNLRHEMNERGTFTVHETVQIMSQTLDGLSSAHRAGVVHRDIKPENILQNDRGRVQITDFGLAKAMSEATLSTTGMLLGTAAYLAPEMIENNLATPQGDLYSVGIMAWEMLAGHVPFTSDNPVTMVFKHVHEDVPSLETVCPGIDHSISAFISHLTARTVEARPTDATAALQELKTISAHIEVEGWQYRYAKPNAENEANKQRATSPLVGTLAPTDSSIAPPPPKHSENTATDDASPATPGVRTDGTSPLSDSPSTDKTDAIEMLTTTFNPSIGNGHPQQKHGITDPSTMSANSTSPEGQVPYKNASSTTPRPTTQAMPRVSYMDRSSATVSAQPTERRTIANDGSNAKNIPTTLISTLDASATVANKPGTLADASTKKTKSQKRSSLRKPVVVMTIILALLAILSSCGVAWWYFMGPGSYYTVPTPEDLHCAQNTECPISDVKWKPYESALKAAGIPYKTSEQFSDSVAKGKIISTDPQQSGAHISKRTEATLKVVISKGVRQATIPSDILDSNSANGKKPMEALSQAGFTNIVHNESKDEYSLDLPQGSVKSITPEPGTTVAHNEKVTLVLSKGPMPVSMPNVIGRSKNDAQAAFADAKLQPTYSEQFSDSVPADSIISTSIKADTQLHWGDKVDVVVSKGPKTVTVPDVRGKNSNDAQQTLEALGLKVKISAPLGDLTHTVRLQSPEPGQQVRVRGDDGNPTVITLTVV
ncbi:serine/threonine-protein kinase [Bifidobacterium commune]|uniref:non-specific serine/threonine protein kinase n=1 Tax=Bifidobacterium commune TaxID=1505727 RepID=A0A1C4H1F7_9BIFI|nr:Stk1 family PASTA domain-containing Ser/Thr kinase [Bifidobacterium commune]MBB2955366.1 serine/threonine-protein kinase [Bifidobacterium commune]SCC78390.1 serine/threonine protein kinase [Bifidobacterium commune]